MKPPEVELTRLATEKGWIDRVSSLECLREADRCQALGLAKSVDEILLERGFLSQEQLEALRAEIGTALDRPRIGGYEIVRRVGLGGAGSVFEARHVRLGQRVALKVLYPRYARSASMTKRFLREARTLARLSHPHLVHAIDVGRDRDYFFLAMEFVDGENLLQHVTRQGPLSVRDALAVVRSVVQALGALDARGLVHRDVKPSNVLLANRTNGTYDRIKLTDLGLLRSSQRSMEGDTWICGTPHYIAPEQALGDEVDVRTDLYSLGATWFHMLAGRPPFVGSTTKEIVQAHARRQPPSVREFRPEVPTAVARTISRWLSKEPDRRPADADAALAEIDELERSEFPSQVSRRTVSPVGVRRSGARPCGFHRDRMARALEE